MAPLVNASTSGQPVKEPTLVNGAVPTTTAAIPANAAMSHFSVSRMLVRAAEKLSDSVGWSLTDCPLPGRYRGFLPSWAIQAALKVHRQCHSAKVHSGGSTPVRSAEHRCLQKSATEQR